MAWTSEMDAKLKELYAEGHSCATIGAMMGKSRNAIIGRVHRIKLPRRGQAYRKRGGNLAPKRSTVAAVHIVNRPIRVSAAIFANREPLPPAMACDVARVSFDDLELHHCRFPVGEPAKTGSDKPLFCGDQSIPGLPYCAAHARRCFAPPPQRKQIHVGDPDGSVVELKPKQSVPA